MSRRILIVDDDDRLCRALRSSLSLRRFDSGIAASYETALQALEYHSFDVVFVDYQLGSRNGAELVREIRFRWPEIDTILMSGVPPERLAVLAAEAGARAYLAKPFGPEALDGILLKETAASGTRAAVTQVAESDAHAVRRRRWIV